MEFIEAPAFARLVEAYLTESEFRMLQAALADRPDAGDVIQGTGGFRKLRWRQSQRGKGKRGGLRIIYYYFPQEQQIWLLTLYTKAEATDLTAAEKKQLKAAIHRELEERRRARGQRQGG